MIIYKYCLSVIDRQTIRLPTDAKILTVQVQDEKICIWIELLPHCNEEERVIYIRGTGQIFVKGLTETYLATVQLHGMVWHLYEDKPDVMDGD